MSNDDDHVKPSQPPMFVKDHPIPTNAAEIDVDELRGLICEAVRAALDNEHIQALALRAGRLARLSPGQTVLKFAVWLDVEEGKDTDDAPDQG
jgi:hypothetical protein